MDKRAERLVDVARMYYEQDRTQNEITDQYGISHFMVSKLLKETRDKGIVTMRVSAPQEEFGDALSLIELVGRCFGTCDGVAVPSEPSGQTANEAAAEAAISYPSGLGGTGLGIGWGHTVGDVAKHMKRRGTLVPTGTFVCPLIGSGSVELKNYHSNESVRSITKHSEAQPKFIRSPACVLSEQELKLTRELDSYHEIYHIWKKLDVALVDIGDFPSVPDFASGIRYGDQLIRQKAVGRILSYSTSSQGHIIQLGTDYAIQTPLELLSRTRHMVGTCSANISPETSRGALKTGYLRHLITPEHVVRKVLEWWAGVENDKEVGTCEVRPDAWQELMIMQRRCMIAQRGSMKHRLYT